MLNIIMLRAFVAAMCAIEPTLPGIPRATECAVVVVPPSPRMVASRASSSDFADQTKPQTGGASF
ncbi:hypothetical protein BD626DRAFT_473801, partial [Schizophyllum amplum]